MFCACVHQFITGYAYAWSFCDVTHASRCAIPPMVELQRIPNFFFAWKSASSKASSSRPICLLSGTCHVGMPALACVLASAKCACLTYVCSSLRRV